MKCPDAKPPAAPAARVIAAVLLATLTALAVNLAAVSEQCRSEVLQALVRSVS